MITKKKRKGKTRIYTWRKHSKTREWLSNYQKNRQLQSIREKFFWSKNIMYGGLCARKS